ncbi:GGDEF domain-containing protein [Enterovibrio calviensis]|uniref:GGDEF domain-containing protein n=1 Tax=Enterovibrio calviensis TaxID=91359 RepID=UPI001FDFF063|nr:GGDEF domain-containing protein [Enterovibrio calviensis]
MTSSASSSRTLIVLFTLVFFSIASIIWFYAGGAKSTYVLSPTELTYRYIDDTPMGGDTQGDVTTDDSGNVVLGCTLGRAYQWPFCEVAISIRDDVTKGVDLTHYHSLVIEASYIAPKPNERLRVYLRNYNPAYSTVDDPVSLKFNGLEYTPSETMSEYTLPLKAFQVLSWWIAGRDLALKHSGPELNNVPLVEIATSSTPVFGDHRLEIKSLRFEGLWLSESQLFRGLTSLWLVVVVVILALKYRQSRLTYKLERSRAERLRTINVALKQKSETLSVLATTDALTGLRNRLDIYEALEERITSRADRSCTVLCLDIDHFKHVNDTYGHDMGDRLLVLAADIMRESASGSDVIVRWGGEEFVIFCPKRNLAQASFLAEKIRWAFEAATWPHGELLSCSIGVSSMRQASIAAMIADADDALYRAKNGGRNRVEVFAESLIPADA